MAASALRRAAMVGDTRAVNGMLSAMIIHIVQV
jgi:hypothetical protein